MSDCRLAHGGIISAALNSYVETLDTRTVLANIQTSKHSSVDCPLIQSAFNTSDADPTALCSTSWQLSEWTSPTEGQLSLFHYWLSRRDMHCMLNTTYSSSMAIIEAMGSNNSFDLKLCSTDKLEEEYFNFQAFGTFDYKDRTISTRTRQLLLHFGKTTAQTPQRGTSIETGMLTWMECLTTDSTAIAAAAYLEAEAIRTGHGVHRIVIGSQSSGVSARLVLSR